MRFVDLHAHTIFSDGSSTPEALILEAKRVGLAAVALVDHDSVEGIERAVTEAATQDIELVPGIELSAEYEGLEVHILGYLIDYRTSSLLERLIALKDARIERVHAMVKKLKGEGVVLDPDHVFELAHKGTVGRLHVAQALVKMNAVRSVFEAFQRYLGDKGPAFVLGFRFSPSEAIQLIKSAKGIPVLAHPYTLRDDELISKFVNYGIEGIEVYYPEHSQSMINYYLAMAKGHNLLLTGGSDFHGDAKPDVRLGSIKVPYELLERLKEAKAARRF